MLTDPFSLLAFLSALLGLVFWVSTFDALDSFFEVLPPVLWAYFLPMFATTFGLTPAEHALYDGMATYLLPFSLFLLMITVDLPAILRLGPLALSMLLVGTLGIVIGAGVSYLLFKSLLPPDAWEGLAALSGSWIGGTANLVAIQQHVGTSAEMLGPIIVVDTVVGYGWMGVLIALSAFQDRFDRWVGASKDVTDRLQEKLAELDTERRPLTLRDASVIAGLGLAATALALWIAPFLPSPMLGDTAIISVSTWAILLVVTVGLALSFTPLRRLEHAGASRLGYFALYLLLTSIGAQADLGAVLDAPIFLLAGALWIAIHVGLLLVAARMLRAPLFFVATGSMANVGGAASAPIVAGVYLPSMAPVGLLMGVAGYILGIYAALGCAEMLRWLSM